MFIKKPSVEDFLDFRNRNLYNLLSKNYEIEIENSSNNEYSCFTRNSEATIFVVPYNKSLDSFTHELLHIYLKYKEFYLGSSIKLLIREDEILSKVISQELLEHIGNCLDHVKMFEIYTDLGFEQSGFLLDFEVYKCSESELAKLKANFHFWGKINPNAVDFFIGKLIAILCDPNKNNDYSAVLFEFKNTDSQLYNIIYKLVKRTIDFDLDSDGLLSSYRDISFDFYDELSEWFRKSLS
ncbi:hypothetical protein [Flavobacterium sp.]|uniref:hypothetical protein n=1 Tax=Flavobacterium sp. TaxID=239 RepID=UPI0039E5BBDB